MLTVSVTQARGRPHDVGRRHAAAFLATPRGKSYRRRKRDRRPPGFDLKQAERAFTRYAPNLWEELEGIAAGLEQPLDKTVGDFGNFTLRYPRTGCSTVVKAGLYGRNYDFRARDYEPGFAVVQPHGVWASAGFTQFLIGRADGMNAAGLACGLHLVSFRHPGPGFLASLIVRMVLDQCANTGEAVELLRRLPHGFSYNFSILDAQGDGAVVEASPRNLAIRRGSGLACTNHFQSPLMRPLNPRGIGHSAARLALLENHGAATERRRDLFDGAPRERLFAWLNNSRGPAFHHGYVKGAGTLHTIVCDTAGRAMLIGIGGDAKPARLDLAAWRDGQDWPIVALSGQLGGRSNPFPPPKGPARQTTSSSRSVVSP